MSLTIESAEDVGIPSSIGSSARPRSGIVIHYVGGSAVARGAHTNCRAQVRSWHNYHRTGQGWAGLGYHYCICHHGIVMTGRGLNRVGAHAPGANATHIGILFMLGGSQQPTADQLAGFRAFRTWLGRQGVRQSNVTPHSQWISTSCPGNHLRSRVANNNWGSGGSPGGPGGGGDELLQRGSSGSAVTALQRDLMSLGYAMPQYGADGSFGAETEQAVRAFQRAAGIGVDGIAGPQTLSAIAAALEETMPDRRYLSTTEGTRLRRDEWTQIQLGDPNEWSLAGISSNPQIFTAETGWRIEGLNEGDEYQVRLCNYDPPKGDGSWEEAGGRRISEHFHGTGDAWDSRTFVGRTTAKQRVRVQIKQWTSDDARVVSTNSDILTWDE